ncbi:MAG: hypothetical protein MUF71_14255 [Candidatus Kapabacteria bacterium]|jgi:hypothetical protein|nr:hypothetical protein [Candidatus Kapabacteria bacterium]
MKDDPTLQEIWDARRKIWEDCDGNSEKLLEYYRQLQKEHSHKIVRFEQVQYEVEEA